VRRSRADAVLLSVVGSDLAAVNLALRREGLHRRLVRLSFALEENALMACEGDDSGLLYAAMPSFTSLTDDDTLARMESHRALFGPNAPVLDTYSHSLYEGIRGVCADIADPAPAQVHLARAQGLQFEVVHTSR
jgi:urea transport system substrate-binding protein